jgi:PX-associated
MMSDLQAPDAIHHVLNNANGNTSAAKREMSNAQLSSAQANALFDILTHHETYHEVQDFKFPETITQYGFPFAGGDASDFPAPASPSEKSGSPILHLLLHKFVLNLPGVTSLPSEIWTVRVQSLVSKLAEAQLSESYDKGALGTRKTLATASSAVVELIARGVIGGYPGSFVPTEDGDNLRRNESAAHLVSAWDKTIQGIIHGPLVNDLFDWMIEHEDLEEYSLEVKGAADYCIIQ